MLGADAKARFMDIGSGVGKLCTLLSFLTNLEIFGLEQREDLFKISQTVAIQNSLSRVHFIHGNMLDLNWQEYDIFYLYNPFQEHTIGESSDIGLIDRNIALDGKYYAQYISEVFRQMTWLEPGKKVIIYHGYGSAMPPSMKLVRSHYVANGHLCLWEKPCKGALELCEVTAQSQN
jgi:SAM-dependent methyltransferase